MAQFHLPHMPHWAMWDTFTHSHMSVLKLFLRYTVPMSILPPAMIYYAGVTYGGQMLPALSASQLVGIGILFYIVELTMTFVVAYVIQQLGEWVQIKPAFEDCIQAGGSGADAVMARAPVHVHPQLHAQPHGRRGGVDPLRHADLLQRAADPQGRRKRPRHAAVGLHSGSGHGGVGLNDVSHAALLERWLFVLTCTPIRTCRNKSPFQAAARGRRKPSPLSCSENLHPTRQSVIAFSRIRPLSPNAQFCLFSVNKRCV